MAQFRTVTVATFLIISYGAATPALGGILWSTIDHPGDVTTQLHGVSDGKVLGSWYDFPNNTSGHFLYEDGNFASLNLTPPAGGHDLIPWKIDGDTIVGWYFDETESTRAFRYEGTSVQPILLPASLSAQALDVSGEVVVGLTVHDAGGQIFRQDSQITSAFNFPGESLTTPEAISGSTIVGFSGLGINAQGFIYDGVDWTPLNYPGASGTRPLGVSELGVTGQFYGAPGSGSFLYAQGTFTELRYPGSLSTEVWDMEGNVIVGSYADELGVHGFYAVVPEPSTVLLLCIGASLLFGSRIRQFREEAASAR